MLFLNSNMLNQLGWLGCGDGAGEAGEFALQCSAMAIGKALGAACVLPKYLQNCDFLLVIVGDIARPELVNERQRNGGTHRRRGRALRASSRGPDAVS